MGSPKARSQTREASTPNARDTPNRTYCNSTPECASTFGHGFFTLPVSNKIGGTTLYTCATSYAQFTLNYGSDKADPTLSQYLLLCTPLLYALTNSLSLFSNVIAAENCVIGCRVLGKLLRALTTCSGNELLDAHSCEMAFTCASVGTSPVISSQKRLSGSGSAPPDAFGRSF
ncbi:hypothetical protein ALC56_07862 [Trachymyrmex septentrionalis]|uniref:Uncharacterized protein n=1 Tax=Trachymyrmex septentrionalis TaxID=34720 RepID=A0A195FB64_9HYME|nr:hypothetical protein ALC56_07862 [Trachymyrmex septentrionalis]